MIIILSFFIGSRDIIIIILPIIIIIISIGIVSGLLSTLTYPWSYAITLFMSTGRFIFILPSCASFHSRIKYVLKGVELPELTRALMTQTLIFLFLYLCSQIS